MKGHIFFLISAVLYTAIYIVINSKLISTDSINPKILPVWKAIGDIELSNFIAIISLLITAYFSVRAINDAEEGSKQQQKAFQTQVGVMQRQQKVLETSRIALEKMVTITEESDKKLRQSNEELNNILNTTKKQEIALVKNIEVLTEQLRIQKAIREEELSLKAQHPDLIVRGSHTIYINGKNEYTYKFTGNEDTNVMNFSEEMLLDSPIEIPIQYTKLHEVEIEEDADKMEKYPKLAIGTEKINGAYIRRIKLRVFLFKFEIRNIGTKHAVNVKYKLNYNLNIADIPLEATIPQLSIFENSNDAIELTPVLRFRENEREFDIFIDLYGDNFTKRRLKVHFKIVDRPELELEGE